MVQVLQTTATVAFGIRVEVLVKIFQSSAAVIFLPRVELYYSKYCTDVEAQ